MNRVPIQTHTLTFDQLESGQWYENEKKQIGEFLAGEIRYTHYWNYSRIERYSKNTCKNPRYHQWQDIGTKFRKIDDPKIKLAEQDKKAATLRAMREEQDLRAQNEERGIHDVTISQIMEIKNLVEQYGSMENLEVVIEAYKEAEKAFN